VLDLRKEHCWNEKAIHEELPKQGVEASFYAIRTVLAEANALGVAPPRKKRAYGRFERPLPNHLWQADFTLLDDETWLFALEDDYSRYAVDAMEFEEPSTENALFVLRRAVAQHGVPYQLLTDHGTQFWNNTQHKPNAFGEIVSTWGIEHILAGVKRPQTCGKIERWFRTYKESIPRFKDLEHYLYYYNYDRPHGGIYYRKPYERYYAYRL
jgi:putative transposase